MRKFIVLLAGLTVMLAMAVPAVAGPFTDVPTDHWAYDAIDKLQSEGFVEGYPDGTFRGNRSFTRYEMAMVVARIWDRLESELMNLNLPDGDWVEYDEFEEELALLYDLMDEFAAELDDLGMRMTDAENRIGSLEDRVSNLETFLDGIQWSGAIRARIEDIITNDYADYGGFLNPAGAGQHAGVIAGTDGSNPGESFEFEQLIDIALMAHPSDFLDVFILLEHRSSYLDTTDADDLTLKIFEAWVDADLMGIMGWTPTDLIDAFNLVVGRQFARFGEFGLAFDNGYMALPGVGIYLSGDRIEAAAFLARNSRFGTQEGIGAARVSYGFGDSRSNVMARDNFARVGVNYLANGAGNESGIGVDLDSELLSEVYLNRVRVEWFQLDKDQLGFSVDDWYGDDYASSIIAWVDLFNDGNTRVSAAYADIGLVPGFSAIDNNPFEEYDALSPGIGGNLNWAYESGLNPFPSNFVGGGMQINHTWWDVLNTQLTVYDGQNQDEEDLPAVIILHVNYPLSDASDVRLIYIHSGIDALTLAKLRGEYVVRF
jgi:hypothetical protein